MSLPESKPFLGTNRWSESTSIILFLQRLVKLLRAVRNVLQASEMKSALLILPFVLKAVTVHFGLRIRSCLLILRHFLCNDKIWLLKISPSITLWLIDWFKSNLIYDLKGDFGYCKSPYIFKCRINTQPFIS